eukprot:9499996-Pyramimonas_sp.AAC.1
MVHSPSMARFIDAFGVDDTPCHEGCRAHFGLQLKLKLKLEQASRWVLPLSERFVYPPAPKKPKDPNSKRSCKLKMKQEDEPEVEVEPVTQDTLWTRRAISFK